MLEQKLRGVRNLTKMYIRQLDNDYCWSQMDGRTMRKPNVFDTDGTNLAAVLTVPDVNFKRTTSNDVIEILSVRMALDCALLHNYRSFSLVPCLLRRLHVVSSVCVLARCTCVSVL